MVSPPATDRNQPDVLKSAMEIPIFENDEQVGTLRVSVQGLYTVFLAELPPMQPAGAAISSPPDEIGMNRSGRLIAAPTERPGNCVRSLSRLWILGRNGSAQELGLLRPGKERRTFCQKFSRLECRRLPSAPDRALVLPNGERPMLPAKQEERQTRVSPAEDGKTNPERRSSHSEFAWRLLPDGSLIDPKRRLLALPWAGKRLPELARKIKVKGEEYLVFRY